MDPPQINDPLAALLSIDPGFTSTKACLRFEGQSVPREQIGEVYVIQFPTNGPLKDMVEFPTTVTYTDYDEWAVGKAHGPHTAGIILNGIKSGLLGEGHELYGPQLHDRLGEINDIRRGKNLPEVNEVDVLEKIFRYAIDVALDFILTKLSWVVDIATSNSGVQDRKKAKETIESIPRDCVLTYPVRDSESLRLQMINACTAVGFRTFYLVAESVAAGCYAFVHGNLGLLEKQSFIVCDFGGATIVRMITGVLTISQTDI